MIHSFKQNILIGLAFASVALTLPAADIKSPAAKKAAPSTLTGRIVFVDKSLHAVAIEVKGKVLQINVVSHVRLAKGGRIVPFEDLSAGQEVTVTFKETPQGHLEVVALSIEGSLDGAEAAGKKKEGPDPGERGKQGKGHDDGPDRFPESPNPANLGNHVRSPNH